MCDATNIHEASKVPIMCKHHVIMCISMCAQMLRLGWVPCMLVPCTSSQPETCGDLHIQADENAP
jgi:hypothetical protein